MRDCGAGDGDDRRYATDNMHTAYAKDRGHPGYLRSQASHGLVAARNPFERPIILRTEMVAGHAGPSGREGRWAARCEEFAFALGQVGITL